MSNELFIDVDPEELIGHREGRRGRMSYPILKSFLETHKIAAQLNRTGILNRNGQPKSVMSLSTSLAMYIKQHRMPIRIMQRKGEIILMRRDIDDNGGFIEDWAYIDPSQGNRLDESDIPPIPITPTVIKQESAARKVTSGKK